MKKFTGKYWKLDLLLGIVTLLVGVLAVEITSPAFGFSSMGEMGTSATGMALIRSILDPPPGSTNPFMGYVLNGTVHHYWNWPPNGFFVYARWLELLGDAHLSNAKVLSSLIYGLTALLLYFLLRKNKTSPITAMVGTVVFIFLPMHLKYGHMVYADIWLPFFWTLALFALEAKTLKRYWLFFLIILLGTSFMWFVIFLLPIPLVLKALNRFRVSKQMTIVVWLGVYLLAVGVVWFVLANFMDQYRVMKLENWSFHYLLRDINGFFPKLLNRLKYLGYESLSLVVLFILSYQPLRRLLDSEVRTEYKGLVHMVTILLAGLVLYALIMPVWFVGHHYGLSMFSVLIATSIALILNIVERYKKRIYVRNVLLVIGITIGLNVIFPSNHAKVEHVNQISQVINQQNFDQHPCIFIDLHDFHQWEHAVDFGIKELTEGYIFNKDFLQESPDATRFEVAKKKLDLAGFSDFQTDRYLVVTNTELHKPENLILELDDIRLYQFEQ